MSEKGSMHDLGNLASKLSEELEELRRINGNCEELKKAVIIKDQLLKEIRAFLDHKNKEAR